MTQFDFDKSINRREVPALKTHPIVLGQDADLLFPAGVADMDFEVAPPILKALERRLGHGVFGYEAVPDGLITALTDWLRRRHHWDVTPEQVLRAPNALNGLAIAASLFSEPGDGIIVQPPVFFDFYDVIRENHREIVRNPLALQDGRYEMDFDDLEVQASKLENTILFLCNPHNPVGRAWSRDELLKLGQICCRHNVLVVSDELHGDIVYPGHRHLPFASLDPVLAKNSITILSPAKTFNIASCCCAFTVVPDERRRLAFQKENSRLTTNKNNAFANVAMEAAFRDGEEWLDAVLTYLQGNLSALRERISTIPRVRLIDPEATFLVWMDFRELALAPEELHAVLRHEANWAITRGSSFGREGEGFIRLNIACQRNRMTKAMDNLKRAMQNL